MKRPEGDTLLRTDKRSGFSILRITPAVTLEPRRVFQIHPMREQQEPDPARIRLVTNSAVQSIGARLQADRPPWENLTHLLRPTINPDHQSFKGDLVETIVKQQLLSYAGDSDASLDIPELAGKKTPHFMFERLPDGKLYINRGHTRGTESYEAEIDNLVKIDGLPTIIEVKLLHLMRNRRKKRTLTVEEWSQKVVHPLQEVYPGRNEFGLVIVTIPEFFQKFPQYQPGFNTDLGIHFYALNTSWQELDDQAAQLLSTSK